MPFTTLISALELNDVFDSCIVIDTRFSLADSEEGKRLYEQGHIPGAYFLDLDKDLSSPITASSGRHPLPDIELLQEKLRVIGVNADSQVVVYDQQTGAFAARLWWLCKWLGHKNVAVLDGGISAWSKTENGQPERPLETSVQIKASSKGSFEAKPNSKLLVTSEYLVSNLDQRQDEVIDARGCQRFAGEVEPIDQVAGHVPGAKNHFFEKNLNSDGYFLSVTELEASHQAHAGAIHMCGSGVTACHNILACYHAGQEMPRLYAGSWSEWIRDTTRPVATGNS